MDFIWYALKLSFYSKFSMVFIICVSYFSKDLYVPVFKTTRLSHLKVLRKVSYSMCNRICMDHVIIILQRN